METSTVSVKDMYDLMKSLNGTMKFAIREQTICAALDILIERGFNISELGLGSYEQEIRKRVPLDA